MKHIHNITLAILVTNLYLTACDDEIKELIMNARTQESLQDTRSVISLNLNNEEISDDSFIEILVASPNIIKLSAQGHQLKNPLPSYCVALTELDLSKGTLEIFPIGSFAKLMPALEKLNLSHNKITSIESPSDTKEYTRSGCGTLQEIPHWQAFHLKELNVSHNKLKQLILDIINNAPNLTFADFSENTITTVQLAKTLEHREVCTIKLHNTSLDSTTRELLIKNNSIYTKEFVAKRKNWSATSAIVNLCAAYGVHFGVIYGLKISIDLLPIMIPVGAVSLFVGLPIGLGLAHCATPEHERTYQPFKLDFGDQDTTNDNHTSINVPLLSIQKN